MRILAVDDKAVPRKVLVRAIEQAAPDAQVTACKNASEVLALPDIASFSVAFVDIDMPGMDGVELAKELKKVHPRLNIVFATGFGEYMADAFALHSSGYLMKPVTAEDVARVFAESNHKLKDIIFHMVPKLPVVRECPCKDALGGAEL